MGKTILGVEVAGCFELDDVANEKRGSLSSSKRQHACGQFHWGGIRILIWGSTVGSGNPCFNFGRHFVGVVRSQVLS